MRARPVSAFSSITRNRSPLVVHRLAFRGHRATHLLVEFVLVGQAAQQAPALSGDSPRIERQPLLTRHPHRHPRTAIRDSIAAQHPSADPRPANDAGLVAHADLLQLDAQAYLVRQLPIRRRKSIRFSDVKYRISLPPPNTKCAATSFIARLNPSRRRRQDRSRSSANSRLRS